MKYKSLNLVVFVSINYIFSIQLGTLFVNVSYWLGIVSWCGNGVKFVVDVDFSKIATIISKKLAIFHVERGFTVRRYGKEQLIV